MVCCACSLQRHLVSDCEVKVPWTQSPGCRRTTLGCCVTADACVVGPHSL